MHQHHQNRLRLPMQCLLLAQDARCHRCYPVLLVIYRRPMSRLFRRRRPMLQSNHLAYRHHRRRLRM